MTPSLPYSKYPHVVSVFCICDSTGVQHGLTAFKTNTGIKFKLGSYEGGGDSFTMYIIYY